MSAAKQIGIAVVENSHRFLVGNRGPDVTLAGFAEFPGGKCRAEESPVECAVRECLEESGLVVVSQRLLRRQQFEYSHGEVDLHFFLCRPADPTTVRDHHRGFRWVSANELMTLNFPPANASIIELLSGSANL